MIPSLFRLLVGAGLCIGLFTQALADDVVLYTSVDEPVARPIIEHFQQQTHIHVIIQTDSEATRSVGLAERIRAERDHPQADVFWSNEPFHTINLAREKLLAEYESPSAKDIAERFKSSRWASSGLRARVIAIRPKDGGVASLGLMDLTRPRWKGKIAMARPTAGTTGGHVAALVVLWGKEKALDYFRKLRGNEIKLLGGNSVVAERVAAGTFAAGLTDNDDVQAARSEVGAIDMLLPDQDSFGTLMIPTTVGMVANAKHPDAAKKLIDYLLSRETDQKLVDAKFALTTVRDPTAGGKIKPMDIDYSKASELLPQAVREATTILEGRE